jgi:hypothetical protein
MARKLIFLIFSIMFIVPLISCGIKSDPVAPKEEKNFDS